MKTPKNIVITGASSGLGAALARHYAASGITLFLQGRNAQRLEQSAEICREKEARVYTRVADVTDRANMQEWLREADKTAPIDLVIANAGVSAGTGGGAEPAEQVNRIFATNVDGVINTIQPLLPNMLARKSGQIAVISSLAGIRSLPSCPAYSASKMAVRSYGEALRGAYGSHGVKVSVVCPGYIKTPMTDVNNFPMPLLMQPDKAADIIARGLAKNKARIAFPLALYIPLYLIACLPVSITDWFFACLPGKAASSGDAV